MSQNIYVDGRKPEYGICLEKLLRKNLASGMVYEEKSMFKPFMRKKFTLIELLVTIAIISILASLLLPALKAAKDQATMIQCISNHKAHGLAVINYTSDCNEYCPEGSSNVLNPWGGWDGDGYWQKMYGYYGVKDVDMVMGGYPFKNYRNKMLPFMCPAGVKWWGPLNNTASDVNNSNDRPERCGIYRDSFVRWDLNANSGEFLGRRKTSWVQKPSSYFIICDTDFTSQWNIDPKYPHHFKRVFGVAFFDGSARTFKRSNYRNAKPVGYWEYAYWRYLGSEM